jgi:hypothetical protein
LHLKLIVGRHAFLLVNMLFQTTPGRVLDSTWCIHPAQKQGQAHLLPELALGIYDQLASLITDALLELHYGLVWLSPIPGTIHLIGLPICAVAGVFLHQTYL